MQRALKAISFRYLMLLLISLILADGIITEFVINNGLGWESNPLIRGLLPTGHFMLVKIGGSLLVAVLLLNIYRRRPRMASVASWVFILFYTCIVYWNIGGMLVSANLGGL